LIYPKLSSLRNDRSINLNLYDHVRVFLAGKNDDCLLQNKERIKKNCDDIMSEIRG